MQDKNNFRVKSYKSGKKVEQLIEFFFNDLVRSNNTITEGQYDNNTGLPDFTVIDTNIYLEIQTHSFDAKEIWIYKRKLWNYTGTDKIVYTTQKDVSKTYFVASDGFKFLVFPAKMIKTESTKDFPKYRGNNEEAYKVEIKEVKQFDASGFKSFLHKVRNKYKI